MRRTGFGSSSVKWFFDSVVLTEQQRWRKLIEEIFSEENGGMWGDVAYTLQLMRDNANVDVYETVVEKECTAVWLRARGIRVAQKNGKFIAQLK